MTVVRSFIAPHAALLAITLGVLAGCTDDSSAPNGAASQAVPVPSEYNSVGDLVTPNRALNPNLFWFDTAGHRTARMIRPLDMNGAPSGNGKIVLLSIGMSNADQEFCGSTDPAGCLPWTFEGRVRLDIQRNPALVIVNGAASGQGATTWESPLDANYDHVKTRLLFQGASEKQVQVIWLKVANIDPTIPLPSPNADAYALERSIGNIVRALRVRYPFLRQVYLSSRSYGGYAKVSINPEPFAFESGFSVGWLVRAQVLQMTFGTIDPIAGDLKVPGSAPWVAWGPYLWTNGSNPRGDGLVWLPGDFEADGTHPSPSGESKVGQLLFNYFRSSPYASCWYFGRTC